MEPLVDWMLHSCQMAQARLDAEKDRDDADKSLLAALDYEVRVRWYVLAHLSVSQYLLNEARVWYVYMACHAHLQMRRYSGTISEATFMQTCKRLRHERDERLQSVTGRWLDQDALQAA